MFEIKHVVMTSDGRLTSSKLESYSGVERGSNLFDVQFDELRANLESVPQVESVKIQRRLPDTLFVRVTERTALAQVHWKWRAVPFLIDRHGVILPPTRSGASLPMIEGVQFDSLRPGEMIHNEGVLYSLRLLAECDDLRLFTIIEFERFDLRNPDYITATLTSGTVVRFPYHSARAKLIRLARVLEEAKARGEHKRTVDLVPDGLNVPTT